VADSWANLARDLDVMASAAQKKTALNMLMLEPLLFRT
jgi:hypothetical protein